MIELDIDGDNFAKARLGFKREGDLAIIKKAPDITARVLIKNDKLQFFPERSSAQKAVLAALQE
jgi:hypothetical protein